MQRFPDLTAMYAAMNFVYPELGGVQADIQVAKNPKGQEIHLCNFNCDVEVKGQKTGGHYECPAAILNPKNKGAKKSTLPNLSEIVSALSIFKEGIIEAHSQFLKGEIFKNYAALIELPKDHQEAIRTLISSKGMVKCNIFGGNAEMRDDLPELVTLLNGAGFSVDMTIVGAIFLFRPQLINAFHDSPPATLAMSMDDVESPEELERLLNVPREDLRAEFEKINFVHGQARKVVAAISTTKLSMAENFPWTVLYNFVVHEGNIRHLTAIYKLLTETFPAAKINFYPSQEAFLFQTGSFTPEGLELFEEFVDWMIIQTKLENNHLTRRLHYWLFLKAVLTHGRNNQGYEWTRDAIGGAGAWTCYRGPTLFGQVGGSFAPPLVQLGSSTHITRERTALVGNCFWNTETVNSYVPFAEGQQVADYLLYGRKKIGDASGDRACRGCNFPRLMDDEVGTVLGMSRELLKYYTSLRRHHIASLLQYASV